MAKEPPVIDMKLVPDPQNPGKSVAISATWHSRIRRKITDALDFEEWTDRFEEFRDRQALRGVQRNLRPVFEEIESREKEREKTIEVKLCNEGKSSSTDDQTTRISRER